MKKSFLLSVLCLGLMASGIAQSSAFTLKSADNNTTGDTVVNTEVEYMVFKVANPYDVVTIQYVATKISGTVAGTAVLQGSLDGTNYANAVVSESGNASFTNTDVATQTNFWYVEPGKYLYYRIKCTGSGTMSARVYGYAITR